MSTPTYTADEFANARFATHPNGLLAMRDLDLEYHPWTVGKRDRHVAHSDEDLAAGGWSPVREAAPVSLDVLRTAWENAEQADECRKGDVLIWADGLGGYHVHPSEADRPLIASRILLRAPQREPWQDLADVLERVWPSGINGANNEGVARVLHIEGLRKTDGDDDA